ncbi:MAG: hypothetical protein Ta2E_10820 [Mycoplasmoidaceae bacterium]|nr:MAG: hypothetical protein Ta2E_10820 [Mycoplasmoidaceae bacterium]
MEIVKTRPDPVFIQSVIEKSRERRLGKWYSELNRGKLGMKWYDESKPSPWREFHNEYVQKERKRFELAALKNSRNKSKEERETLMAWIKFGEKFEWKYYYRKEIPVEDKKICNLIAETFIQQRLVFYGDRLKWNPLKLYRAAVLFRTYLHHWTIDKSQRCLEHEEKYMRFVECRGPKELTDHLYELDIRILNADEPVANELRVLFKSQSMILINEKKQKNDEENRRNHEESTAKD